MTEPPGKFKDLKYPLWKNVLPSTHGGAIFLEQAKTLHNYSYM